jgi:sugar transferase (PEP-CTERM/EpsH1 system associated)
MRIFYITQRVPYPPDRGDKITTCNVLRHLARSHEVHVFCTADGQADLANLEGARAIAASVTAVPTHPFAGKLRALAALVTGAPLSVAMMHERALHAPIDQAYARLKPDLIIVYSSNVAQFAEHFAATPRIMQFADLDSLKWTRYAAETRPPMRWIYALEGRRLLEYERHIAHAFEHSLVCTDAERHDFEAAIPGAAVSTVKNGVDFDYFQSAHTPKTPANLVFTGVMDYFPNVDAVQWFATDILPRIQAVLPHATFTICGSRPSPAVQVLASRPGVAVTGRVPDVRPYLDAAEVFVAPLRIARGIQNKVLEAMAMELPVVASMAAWTGTEIPLGEAIEASDDPQQFADLVIHLLQNPSHRASMGQLARQIVIRNYAWATQMTALDTAIAAAMKAHGERRQG